MRGAVRKPIGVLAALICLAFYIDTVALPLLRSPTWIHIGLYVVGALGFGLAAAVGLIWAFEIF
jgi:hypothetical protein